MLSSNTKMGKYTHRVTLNSKKRKDEKGDGKYTITIRSNNPSFREVSKKAHDKQEILNNEYLAPEKKTFHIPSTAVEPVIKGPIERTKFKLILNPGTDTTTTAIIGSSFAAGKTTIMMKAVLPNFYGNGKKQKKMRGKDYINILFCDNPGIKLYDNYDDLIQCRGFDKPQQDIISDIQDVQIGTKNKYRISLYVDDILNVNHSKMIDKMFLTLRNLEISSCICVQYLYMISKKCRSNIQNLIFCKLLSNESIQNVLDVYLDTYFTNFGYPKKDHINLYRQLTDDFNFIHLHQGSNQIFLCKAVKI